MTIFIKYWLNDCPSIQRLSDTLKEEACPRFLEKIALPLLESILILNTELEFIAKLSPSFKSSLAWRLSKPHFPLIQPPTPTHPPRPGKFISQHFSVNVD
jgi:hypothetical protein